jgi:hypothetical protein
MKQDATPPITQAEPTVISWEALETRTAEPVRVEDMVAIFGDCPFRMENIDVLPPDDVPEPYARLLVHREHMTVTLEDYHHRPVDLVVLARRTDGQDYSRQLLLTAGPGGPVVMAGVMRFSMRHCGDQVRAQVLEENTPLGRILISHCQLRSIRTHSFFRIRLTDEVRQIFGCNQEASLTYGRAAAIVCGYEPTVELLEIVAPEHS